MPAMGTRNLAYIGMDEWRARVPTLADMMDRNWKLRARCSACERGKDLDLGYVASVRGLDYSLWNRSQPCRIWRCKGTVMTWVLIPGLYQWRRLQAGDYVPRENLGQRAERLKREARGEV